MRRSVLIFLVVSLLGAACSSTSERSASKKGDDLVAASGLEGDGADGSSPPDAPAAAVGGDVGAAGAPGSAPSSATGSGASSGVAGRPGARDGASGSPGSGGGGGGSSGGGPSIAIGYTINDTAGAQAIFGTDVRGGNSEQNKAAGVQEMEALVKWANATGGVGGRSIEAHGFTMTVADALTRAEQVCREATEDRKVTAYIDRSHFGLEPGIRCFASHRTTLVTMYGHTLDDQGFRDTRPYVLSTWARLDRTARALVDGLSAVGYFDNGTVGVVVEDTPTMNRVYENVLKPALEAKGVRIAETARIHQSDAGLQQTQASNAVLRFGSRGVDRVVFAAAFVAWLSFIAQAQAQGYFPRYGYMDYGAVALNAGFYGSAATNRGAVAVSVSDAAVISRRRYDTRAQTYDARNDPELLPGRRRCLDILSQQLGRDYYAPNNGQSIDYHFYCDHFLLWLDAARKVGAGVTPTNLADGMRALGRSYPSINVYATDYSSGRLDGGAAWRAGVYAEDTSCKCFVDATGWRPLG